MLCFVIADLPFSCSNQKILLQIHADIYTRYYVLLFAKTQKGTSLFSALGSHWKEAKTSEQFETGVEF